MIIADRGYIVFQRSGIRGKRVMKLRKEERWDWFVLLNMANYFTFPGLLADDELDPYYERDFAYLLGFDTLAEWEELKQKLLDVGLMKRAEVNGCEYLYMTDYHIYQDRGSNKGQGKRVKDRFSIGYIKLDDGKKAIYESLVRIFKPRDIEIDALQPALFHAQESHQDCTSDSTSTRNNHNHNHNHKNNTPPTPPKKVTGQLSSEQENLFDKFWEAYPKKKSKGQAKRTWSKLNPSEQLVEIMISTIERAKTSKEWTEHNGKYVPHPSTWLNAEGWLDEFEEEKHGRTEGGTATTYRKTQATGARSDGRPYRVDL
ncbi:MAG: hypothetical protein AB1401_00820 [Thermodesulfobacteriota bacterium]